MLRQICIPHVEIVEKLVDFISGFEPRLLWTELVIGREELVSKTIEHCGKSDVEFAVPVERPGVKDNCNQRYMPRTSARLVHPRGTDAVFTLHVRCALCRHVHYAKRSF